MSEAPWKSTAGRCIPTTVPASGQVLGARPWITPRGIPPTRDRGPCLWDAAAAHGGAAVRKARAGRP